MFKNKFHKYNLYNTLLILSRNIFFYKKVGLSDTFETRIYLMFFHFSIMMIIFKIKKVRFDQKEYDSLFDNIEYNLRELGFGDVSVSLSNFTFFPNDTSAGGHHEEIKEKISDMLEKVISGLNPDADVGRACSFVSLRHACSFSLWRVQFFVGSFFQSFSSAPAAGYFLWFLCFSSPPAAG